NPTKPPRALTWIAACCAASLMAAPAAATTYVMMADQDLADQTPVIAVVRVSAIEPSSEAGAPATDYVARVERAVKGAITGSVRVRVRGGDGPDGVRLRIFGVPRFSVGERALLFLEPRGNDVYGVVQAVLGAFHESASP